MLLQKKLIVVLAAQSAALLASGFVAPTPFGALASRHQALSTAGPLCVSAVEDEAAEKVAEPEVPETEAVAEVAEPEVAESAEEETDEEDEVESPVAVADTEEEDTEAEEEEEAEDFEEEEAKAAPEKQRLTVFVGNLPFQTTDSEVRDLFAEYGTVELVSVPRNRETGQARGFAFVDMATREELDAAIEGVNGIMYGGRTIRAAESLPKEQVQKTRSMEDEGVRKIYVGNLPFDTDKEELLEFYAQHGTVKDVYIPLDVASGRGRGFAFVTMDAEDTDRAIEETNGEFFMGRKLAVSVPLPRGQKAPPRRSFSDRTKLYVGNLSFYTSLDTIKDLFEEYGTVLDCYLPEDRDTGGSRGFAFVTMDNEGAQVAIEETDGFELEGRIIRVNEAQPRDSRPPRRMSDDYDGDDYDEEGESGYYDDGSEY